MEYVCKLGFKKVKNAKIYRQYTCNYNRKLVPERLLYNPEIKGHKKPELNERKLVYISTVGEARLFKRGTRINIVS